MTGLYRPRTKSEVARVTRSFSPAVQSHVLLFRAGFPFGSRFNGRPDLQSRS